DGQALVIRSDRREAFEGVAQVVPEIAREPTQERRRSLPRRGLRAGWIESPDHAARRGERVGPGRRRNDHLERIGGQERPAGGPSPARALEQGEAGEVTEPLGRVHRGDTVERRPALEPWPRAR